MPGTDGVFDIRVAEEVIWSRAAAGEFPDLKLLKQLVRDRVAPGKALGHSDRPRPPAPRPEALPYETGFATAGDGVRIYYETVGNRDRAAMVFCHGLGGNHASWFQQVPAFASQYFVVTWDQRGFGRSPRTPDRLDTRRKP